MLQDGSLRKNSINPVLLSIITVCFNAEKTIRKTLESILEQENISFEYIIKDGNSSDETNGIINEYKKSFYKKSIAIQHIISQDNGIYNAMNLAATKAHGKYLLFLNADDILFDTKVLSQVFSVERDNDILYGDTIMQDECDQFIFNADMTLIEKRMPFSHQSCFIKKSTFDKFLYDTTYKISGDYDLILKIYFSKSSFYNLNQIISIYSLQGISSTMFLEKLKEYKVILRKHKIKFNLLMNFYKTFEAIIKEIIYKMFSYKQIKELRNFYKKYFKKYKFYKSNT